MTNRSSSSLPSSIADFQEADLRSLSQALVLLARHLDQPCEEVQASRLVSEVMRSQPGTMHDLWWNWLLSAGRSLGLTLRVSDIPPRDLATILQTGAYVVAESRAAEECRTHRRAGDAKRLVLVGTSSATPAAHVDRKSEGALLRVIIAAREPDLGSGHHRHEKPWTLLWKLLAPEHKDLWAVVAISGVAGMLMLSVPVTAQQLVRTVTFATLYQPILVLSLMLLGLLGFLAALQALQVYVAEIIQRRLFIRIAGQVTQRLTHAEVSLWRQHAVPELVNRFLEVAIVQKVTAALTVDGIAILLSTVIGMSVMAFYHPFLLGYDIALLVLLATIFLGFGRKGVATAIQESRTKYGVLSWLEDMARCPTIFRTGGVEFLAMQRTDVLCAEYLRARRSHFTILIRQIILVLILQAIATTALLGLGGFLVLNEQLTLGQLVAAELIVAMIVASFAKLGKHLEGWYDLLAAVDKLSHLLDLPTEPYGGLIGMSHQGPAAVVIRNISSPEAVSQNGSSSHVETVRVAPGETAALVNWNPSMTRDLADSLRGLRGLSGPDLTIDGIQVDDIRTDTLRQQIAVASDLEFLPGTIAENIHLSRPRVSEADVREACDAVGLTEELRNAGLGLTTQLLPGGWPLNATQQRRLVLARALAGQPRVLFIDHLCDVFAVAEFRQIWQHISLAQPGTTILIATARQDLADVIGQVAHGSLDDRSPEMRTH